MARTSALGHWLKSSKGKGKQRVASVDAHATGKGGSHESGVMGVKKVKRDGQMWRVRGSIWTGALGLGVGVDLAGTFLMKILPWHQGSCYPHRFDFRLANTRRQHLGLQGHPKLNDCLVFSGTHLEPVGELRQEGERTGEGYQDEGRDRIRREP